MLGLAQDGRESQELWPRDGAEELCQGQFQPRPAFRVAQHLKFVHHDQGDRPQHMRMPDEQLGEFFVYEDGQVKVPVFDIVIKFASVTRCYHDLDAIGAVTRPKGCVFFFRQGTQRR